MSASKTSAAFVEPRHGGDIDRAMQLYGIPEGGWLDLSTGINPVPYPLPDVPIEAFTRLPAIAELAALNAAARDAYRLDAAADLIAVPGVETAIRLLPRLVPPTQVAVIRPTYSTHATGWRDAGHEVREIAGLADVPAAASVVVVVNPNNPDGRITPPDELRRVARALGARGGLLIVDESFADLTPEISMMPELSEPGAIVFRSFGKFYGLAGLRLGFVAGADGLVSRLRALAGAWPVSGAAIHIAQRALEDRDWQPNTRGRLGEDGARLREMLAIHGIAVTGGTDLFALVEDDRASELHAALARQGIWTRVFDYNPRWLRIGLPAPDQFPRLAAALTGLPGARWSAE